MPLPRQRSSSGEPTQPFRGIGRGLLVLLLLGTVTFAVLGLVGDFEQISALIRGFDGGVLALVLLLSAVNYGLRYLRWQYYLRRLDVHLRPGRSLAIFLTGFLLAVTPGKAGELAKAWMAREFGAKRARPVVAVVVTERLLDVLAVLLLLASSVLVFTGQRSFVAPVVLVATAVVVAVIYRPVVDRLIPMLAKTRLGAGRAAVLIDIHQAFNRLVEPRTLLVGLALSTAAWAAEGIGCALVVRHYEPAVPMLASVFDYAASSMAGAISMLPGGLLAAEGSLVLLLERQGVALDAAMASTVIVRAATLWFAVVVGLLALPWVLALLRRR
ncbi:MAG: flippase-like domain-containing protein [Acidobacteria bacterium]|nr:flippase-like domain-containing protein [Acidobacteriota bacterium]